MLTFSMPRIAQRKGRTTCPGLRRGTRRSSRFTTTTPTATPAITSRRKTGKRVRGGSLSVRSARTSTSKASSPSPRANPIPQDALWVNHKGWVSRGIVARNAGLKGKETAAPPRHLWVGAALFALSGPALALSAHSLIEESGLEDPGRATSERDDCGRPVGMATDEPPMGRPEVVARGASDAFRSRRVRDSAVAAPLK